MSEERFSVDLRKQHRFPLDMSLNGFCRSLAKDFPEGSAPTRKLIYSALSALSFDGKPSYDSKETLYTRVLENSYVEERSQHDHNTYPRSICWETQDLLKAVCKARTRSRTLRDQSLAQETLDILLQQLKDLPEEQLASKYVDFQLLRDSYIRTSLMHALSPEIIKRLDTICWLTFAQPETVALKTMPTAFEQLDSLIITLLQQDGIAESMPQETQPLNVFCDYYDRLVSIREADNPAELKCEAFTFVLEDDSPFMISLKEAFGPPKGKDVSEKKAADERDCALLFEKYLRLRAEAANPMDATLVREFVHGYSGLKAYLRLQDTGKAVEDAVREEIYRYLKNIFNDIVKGDTVASDYSDYSDYEATSAEFAYIKTLCKNAHNQIRAKIHLALRLLQTQNHYFRLISDLLEDSDTTFKEKALKAIEAPLSDWNKHAASTRGILAKENPSALLIKPENISAVIALYNEKLSSLTGDRLDADTLRDVFKEISESNNSLWSRCNALAYLLRLDCQLIAYTLAEEAISEIKKTHQILQEHYQKCT